MKLLFCHWNERDTNGCNNDNDKLSDITTSTSSRQVNLTNNDIKKINIIIKDQKRNEKGRSVTVVVGDSIVKKVKGWGLSTKDYFFIVRLFPGVKIDEMEMYFKDTLNAFKGFKNQQQKCMK